MNYFRTIFKNLNFGFFYLSILLIGLINFQSAKAVLIPLSITPSDGSTNIARSPDITFTFSLNVCQAPGIAHIKRTSDDYNMGSYSSIDGLGTTSVTIHTNAVLDPSTSYYWDVEYLFYECGNGSNYITVHLIHFTTGTCTGTGTCGGCYNPPSCIGPCFSEDPVILHKSPPDDAHFMQAYEGINMILDRTVTVGVGNATIRKYDDDTVFETIDITSNKVTGWGTNSITINPTGNLADNTHYYINLDLTDYGTSAEKDNWDFWTKSKPNTFSGTGL